MESNFTEIFEGLKPQKPLFYSWPVGIRFELGIDDEIVVQDSNEAYFAQATDRAYKLFSYVFGDEDDISIIYQRFSDGRQKIRKRNFIFKQISSLDNCRVAYEDVRDIYELYYKSHCWKRVTISGLKTKDVNHRNILLSLVHTDCSTRKPRIDGECYFINHTKSIALNLYDDRGMDIIATHAESLQDLYHDHNEWILDYDRERIDAVFKSI